MRRTALCDRELPSYTKGEEIFNMVTHIVGGGIAVLILVISVLISAFNRNAWAVVTCALYGGSMIALYSVSSIYHGMHAGTGKKVMQVIDHCTIYALIAGTYTPILLIAVRPQNPIIAWSIFFVQWGLAAIAVTLTAIDLKKYQKFSMICYIGMGWCIVLVLKPALDIIGLTGFLWLLAGGIAYTIGAVLYGLGRKHKYMHSVFHIFVVIGSVFQFIAILYML